MIESVINGIQVLTSNSSALVFDNDDIRTKGSCWLCHQEGSPLYKINECGIYEITFNANVTSATAGAIALAINIDGINIPSATAIQEIFTAGDYSNISITKLIKICKNGNANISIASVPSVLTGTTPAPTDTVVPIIQNANFSIKRKA